MGVKKYKPRATPHLLGTKVIKARDRTNSAIGSARKTVQSARIALKRTQELIEQSRQIIDVVRKRVNLPVKNDMSEPGAC